MDIDATYIMVGPKFTPLHGDEPGPRGEQGYSIPLKPRGSGSGSGKGFTNTFELVLEKPKHSANDVINKIVREQRRYYAQLKRMAFTKGHYSAIRRAIRYGDRIPRKYRRMYPDLIKRLVAIKDELPESLLAVWLAHQAMQAAAWDYVKGAIGKR